MDIDEQRKQREHEGQKKYGRIDPANDPRCFKDEMVNELLDAIN